MKTKDQFSADMSKLFSLVGECCGGSNIQEAIFGWFNGDINVDAENSDDWVESYTNSEKGMFYVLFDIVNYDLISLFGKKVNVKQSNHPEIATIVKRWASEENVKKVYESIYE